MQLFHGRYSMKANLELSIGILCHNAGYNKQLGIISAHIHQKQ